MAGNAGFLAKLFRLMGTASTGVPPREISRLITVFAGRVKREWLAENQKLDISVSSREDAAFRFSISDFGERGALSPVIRRYVSGFRGRYDLRALDRFLKAGAALGKNHQTTFGLDWGGSRQEPRLKIYFEELLPGCTVQEKRKLVLEAFAPAAGTARYTRNLSGLSAVCLDLEPGRGCDHKFYYRKDALRDLSGPKWQRGALAGLGLEKKCFYYEMRGAGSGRVKAYKVYEVGGISDFQPGLREICGFYAKAGGAAALRRILSYARFSRGAGMRMVPVLFAAGDAAPSGRTFDSYFCFKPLPGKKAKIKGQAGTRRFLTRS